MEQRMTLLTLMKNVSSQLESGDIKLLCEINMSAEELEYIRSMGDRLVTSVLNDVRTFDILVAYYMMDVGIRFYNDGNYWDRFWEQLNEVEYSQSKQTMLSVFFEKTIHRHNLAWAEVDGRKYVGNILMHAFIPEDEAYRDSFFDFIYRFYKIVLMESIPDDLDTKLTFIEDVFSREDVSENYPELSRMVLIKSMKSAFSDKEFYERLVTKILRRMANDYESSEEVDLGIFNDSFKKWSISLNTGKKSNLNFNEAPYLYFDFNNNGLYLNIPQRVVESGSNVSCRVISSNGDEMHATRVHAYENFGQMMTENYALEVTWDVFDEFSLIFGGKEIFRNRNPGHILFSRNGKRSRRVSSGHNLVLMPPDESIRGTPMASSARWVMYMFFLSGNGTIDIMGENYSIEDELSENIDLLTRPLDITCTDDDDNEYRIYTHHPSIRVSPIPRDNQIIDIRVSRGLNRIRYMNGSDLKGNPAVTFRGDSCTIDLDVSGLEDDDGIYTISYRGRNICKYLLRKGFTYRFDESFYESSKNSTFHYGEDNYIEFNSADGILNLPEKTIDGRNLYFSVEIPSNRFSFDKVDWYLFGTTEIYYRDLTSDRIYVYCPHPGNLELIVDVPKSCPLKMELDGSYLTCKLDKVKQIGELVRISGKEAHHYNFKCGDYDAFRIRYSSEYSLQDDLVVRAPVTDYTYAVCHLCDGTELRMDGASVELPEGYQGNVSFDEVYDDGFGGTTTMYAGKLYVGLNIITDEKHIMKDDVYKFITVSYNGEYFKLQTTDFPHLLGPDEVVSKDKLDYIRESYNGDTLTKSLKTYDMVCDKLVEIILRDNDPIRLKLRADKVKEAIPELALRFYRRSFELKSNPVVEMEIIRLEKLMEFMGNTYSDGL